MGTRAPVRIALSCLVLAGAVGGAIALLAGGEREEPGRAGPDTGRPPPPAAVARTAYYVSAEGSDDADGTSPDRAWATVARVNAASLRPGDGVLFEGGARFDDADLEPPASGTAGAPIVYGSHGRGRARLGRSIFLRGRSFVVLQDLEIAGTPQGVASLASSPSGSRGVVVQRNVVRDTAIAVNSAHEDDADWTIRGNRIADTGDSAVIVAGERARIEGNSIDGAGLDDDIEYGKHGIYLKGAHGTVVDNRIRDFPDGSAVSVRRRDSRVERNDLANGTIGISWFQEDEDAGTSRWRANRIAGTTRACIYVSPSDTAGQTRESFVITGNVLSKEAGLYLNLAPTAGRYTLAGNVRR